MNTTEQQVEELEKRYDKLISDDVEEWEIERFTSIKRKAKSLKAEIEEKVKPLRRDVREGSLDNELLVLNDCINRLNKIIGEKE